MFSSKNIIPFRCESIPRANHLADIAAEDPTADLLAQFCWDVVFELDREIGNATGRVDGSIRKDAVCGAGVDAARTRATMIGYQRWIRFEVEIKKDF